MFSVYCPGHGSRVLPCTGNIERMDNSPHGIHVHWRCFCGETGVWHTGR
jgi:hypothetical protein